MAIRYYDDILAEKLKRWIPENSNLRVLKPDETKRRWETIADDTNDSKFKMPFIALSRSNEIELLSVTKQAKSYDGLTINGASADLSGLKGQDYTDALQNIPAQTLKMNVIPIKVVYQLDIYTKKYDEGDEYLRNFLFKLINNPVMIITIPYNGLDIQHKVNIRVYNTVSDTSDISEHLFAGQFTRWTIQLELQDAFLFSIPYKKNWMLDGVCLEVLENESDLEVADIDVQEGKVQAEIEPIL